MAILALGIATAALAQSDQEPAAAPSAPGKRPLDLPENPQLFGTTLPSVVKATALVNGEVITQSDIDQRLALLAISNGGAIMSGSGSSAREAPSRSS